jgi:hypothetical protein
MSLKLYRAAFVALILAFQWISVSAQQQPGTWQEATLPADAKTGYTGALTIIVDPVKKSDCWVGCADRGMYKSTDYGISWTKINTGTNGDKLNSGRQWYMAIDPNINRDPSTSPAIYTTLGYGSGCIWKSTNGGVDWTNVWNNNIFSSDGLTNISADIGGDVTGVMMTDSSGPNHLVAFLHSYYGTGNNNGVFESTDGGAKWIIHKSSTFNFQPHSDRLFTIMAKDKSTWCVVAGTTWPSAKVMRSTNNGASWADATGSLTVAAGRCILTLGTTVYSSSAVQGLFKSADNGASWSTVSQVPWDVTNWVVATGTRIYASLGTSSPTVYQTSINDDKVWQKLNVPGSSESGEFAATTFDGSNYIILAARAGSGVWRYVEPASTTSITPVSKLATSSRITNNSPRILPIMGTAASLRNAVNTGSAIHDLQGREMRGALKSTVGVYILK